MELQVFPGTVVPADFLIRVESEWNGSVLSLRYHLNGPYAQFKGTQEALSSLSQRRDELWKTTCFEAFLRPEGAQAYWEMNFAANGDWAFYRFDYYREGMRPPPVKFPPLIQTVKKQGWELQVSFDLSDQFEIVSRPLMFSPCAVMETRDGEKSYWALQHHRPQPDFHHADNFSQMLLPKGQS